jgi:ApbE superfamily uncharacterized protein (UPF0280 family)
MTGPTANLISDGTRLHLQHGPIDLILMADPQDVRTTAFRAAAQRFKSILQELVQELPVLRSAVTSQSPKPIGTVAQKMHAAVLPHHVHGFVTPMAAVAGAVADEVLAAMLKAAPLTRASVNNGGDIALSLAPNAEFKLAMHALDNQPLGHITLTGSHKIGGIATSGRSGRSFSLGIADSVTCIAKTAAQADAAATLIANAVDLPGHTAIIRQPALERDPDSDLGSCAVVTGLGSLPPADIASALTAGETHAKHLLKQGLIEGAALFLKNQNILVGQHNFHQYEPRKQVSHAPA